MLFTPEAFFGEIKFLHATVHMPCAMCWTGNMDWKSSERLIVTSFWWYDPWTYVGMTMRTTPLTWIIIVILPEPFFNNYITTVCIRYYQIIAIRWPMWIEKSVYLPSSIVNAVFSFHSHLKWDSFVILCIFSDINIHHRCSWSGRSAPLTPTKKWCLSLLHSPELTTVDQSSSLSLELDGMPTPVK